MTPFLKQNHFSKKFLGNFLFQNFGFIFVKMKYVLIILSLFGSCSVNRNRPEVPYKSPNGRYLGATKSINDVSSVVGKNCLFIGDSHTSNDIFGYQKLLCDYTGMTYTTCAKSGVTTKWMLDYGFLNLANELVTYDYCFIYGGANDAFNSVDPVLTIMNIQGLVRVCNRKNIQCFVITGFDPFVCVRDNKNVGMMKYKVRYNRLQDMMVTQLHDCQVIDTRSDIKMVDCGDGLCHMKRSGHLKLALSIAKQCGFEVLTH